MPSVVNYDLNKRNQEHEGMSEEKNGTANKDRRRFKRRHLLYYLKVTDVNGYPLGHLVDITEDGVLLMGEEPFSEGDYLTFHMTLPAKFEGDEKVELQARCQWEKESRQPHLFEGGFQFYDVTQEIKDTIRDLIDQFGMQDELDHEGRPSNWNLDEDGAVEKEKNS